MKRRVKKISSAILIAFAVICFWRGIWGLLDIYLFPNNYILSLGTSVVIGVIILILNQQAVKQLM